jgi:hypothetical protein
MTARELKHDVYPDDHHWSDDVSLKKFWKGKLRTAKSEPDFQTVLDSDGSRPVPSLYEDIRNNGIHTPVQVHYRWGNPHLYNGHHRVAVAHDLDPNMLIPVEHLT